MCHYQFVGSVTRPGFDLDCARGQFLVAAGAIEVVRVVHLSSEPQRLTVNYRPVLALHDIT